MACYKKHMVNLVMRFNGVVIYRKLTSIGAEFINWDRVLQLGQFKDLRMNGVLHLPKIILA